MKRNRTGRRDGLAKAALYRTRVTHLRRAPVHHYFEHRGYTWHVDLDDMPQLPWWIRPFARFEARDHLHGNSNDTLRQRVDAFLGEHGIDLRGGRITALMQARVLGYVFNPLTLYWCHDDDGVLRQVIAEVHNTSGARHAYLMPPSGEHPAMVRKNFHVSPFTPSDGYYLVHAPRPGARLDIRVSFHRDHEPAFVVTQRGNRRHASTGAILALQVVAPLAPLMGALAIWVQAAMLVIRRVPLVPRVGAVDRTPAPGRARHQEKVEQR